jgi:hypothetical protein
MLSFTLRSGVLPFTVAIDSRKQGDVIIDFNVIVKTKPRCPTRWPGRRCHLEVLHHACVLCRTWGTEGTTV